MPERALEPRQQFHRVPDGLTVDHNGCRGDCHSDERVQTHRQGKPQRLPKHLVALGFHIASKIGDVQRQRRPEPDIRRQRGEKEGPELAFPLTTRHEL